MQQLNLCFSCRHKPKLVSPLISTSTRKSDALFFWRKALKRWSAQVSILAPASFYCKVKIDCTWYHWRWTNRQKYKQSDKYRLPEELNFHRKNRKLSSTKRHSEQLVDSVDSSCFWESKTTSSLLSTIVRLYDWHKGEWTYTQSLWSSRNLWSRSALYH